MSGSTTSSDSTTLTVTAADQALGRVEFTVTGHQYAPPSSFLFLDGPIAFSRIQRFLTDRLRVEVMDVDAGTGQASLPVPWGSNLHVPSHTSTIEENGIATLEIRFTDSASNVTSGMPPRIYDMVVDWDDPDESRKSTFHLAIDLLNLPELGTVFQSSTDDTVLTLVNYDLQVRTSSIGPLVLFTPSFQVEHPYVDDGDPAIGNGTNSDVSNVVITLISENNVPNPIDNSIVQLGGTVFLPTTVANVAPTLTLASTTEVGAGGVATLSGTIADPGKLDAFKMNVNWGDGTTQDFTFDPSATGTQNFVLGHVYTQDLNGGAYNVTATVIDDDNGSHTANASFVVDFDKAPVAFDDFLSTDADQTLLFNVLADNDLGSTFVDPDTGIDTNIDLDSRDFDPEGQLNPANTVIIGGTVSPAAAESLLTNNGDGTFTLDPTTLFASLPKGQTDTVTFDYQIEDVLGQTATATVQIVVTGVNTDPTISADNVAVAVDEGQTAANTGTFADVDTGDNVTITASVGTITQDTGNSGSWSWSLPSNDGPDESRTVTITADDGKGGTARTEFDLTVNNVPPSLTVDSGLVVIPGYPGYRAIVDESLTATVTGAFFDPGLDVVTITTSVGTITQDIGNAGNWSWSFDTSDGPDDSQPVTITATDSDGAQSTYSFLLVANNVPPSLTVDSGLVVIPGHPGYRAIVDESLTAVVTGTFFDPGQDDVTIAASVGTITQDTGRIGNWAWSFDATDGPGDSQTVEITATDSDGASNTWTFPLVVNNVAPTANPDDATTSEEAAISIDVLADDTDPAGINDPLVITAAVSPHPGVIVSTDGAVVSFDPNGQFESLAVGEIESVGITYWISDGDGGTASGDVTVIVTGVNDRPTVSAVSDTTNEDAGTYSLDLLAAGAAADVDATDVLSVSALSQASGRAIGFTLNGNNLEFNTDQFNDLAIGESATLVFDFSVSGDSGASNGTASSQTTVIVEGRNDGPSLTAGSASITAREGDAATNSGSFDDVDLPDVVSISATAEDGAAIGTITQDTGNSGTWSWSLPTTDGPDESQTVTITADDGKGGTAQTTFALTVNNVAPSVAAADATVTVDEGQTASNTGAFSDPGADTVGLTASVGTVIDNGDGTWSWSFNTSDGPDESQTVTITATDSDRAATNTTFALVVDNVAPMANDATFDVVENSPEGTSVGTFTATDPGSDTLTYSITGGTGQMAFAIDPITGEITVADSAELDYETTASFDLVVTVADEEEETGAANVTVNLLNQASITGTVFVDTDQNGFWDDVREMGVDGVVLELLDEFDNTLFDAQGNAITAITSDGGFYLFEDFDPDMYRIRELQPSGVDDGAEQLGSLGGAIVANDTMQLTLDRTDASDYIFAEIGQQVAGGDTATIGFWQNKHGQALIAQGGAELADWLTDNFGNVFGNQLAGADGLDVARFFKQELFKQKAKKSAGPAKVDAQFTAVALSTYFTSSNLAGYSALDYSFNVTDTGIGTKIVNVGTSGDAFRVADNTERTIMQLLLATNDLTDTHIDAPDLISGFAHTYDLNGDGVIDAEEARLRSMANEIYTAINEQGDL